MKNRIFTIALIAATGSVFGQTTEPFPNGGFENWGSGSTASPVSFNSLNPSTSILGIITCVKATGANVRTGNAAAKLKSAAYALAPGGVIQGMMTTGTISVQNQDITSGMPFTSRPDSVVAWAKYTPALNSSNVTDTGYVEILLLNDLSTDTVGRGRFNIFTTVAEYTRLSAPIVYFNSDIPVRLRAIINASSGYSPTPNSELYIDDAEFIYNPSAINENVQVKYSVYPNPANDKIYINYQENEVALFSLFDLNGKVVSRQEIDNGNLALVTDAFAEGVYMFNIITSSGKSSSGKIAVKR